VAIATSLIPDEYLDLPLDDPKVVRLIEAISRMRHYAKLQGYDPPLNAWDLCRLIAQEANCSQRHAYRNMQIWFRYRLDPKTKLPPRIQKNKAWEQIEDWEEIGTFLTRKTASHPTVEAGKEVCE
jgi:hypothetical protein